MKNSFELPKRIATALVPVTFVFGENGPRGLAALEIEALVPLHERTMFVAGGPDGGGGSQIRREVTISDPLWAIAATEYQRGQAFEVMVT